MASHYEVLRVARDASAVEIKQAFRLLARRWHPDKQGQRPDGVSEEEATQRFQRIQSAYEVLNDESRRDNYDRQLGESVGETAAAQSRYAGDKRARPAHMHFYGMDLRWFEESLRWFTEDMRWYEDHAGEHKQYMEELQRRQEQMLREAARKHERLFRESKGVNRQWMKEHTRKETRHGKQQTQEPLTRQERAALHWDKFKDMYPQWRSMTVGERMQRMLEILAEPA